MHATRVFGRLGSLCRVNRDIVSGPTRISFLPRFGTHPAVRFLRRLGPTARVRIASSHIKGNWAVRVLVELARRVASVEVIAEPTLRRVPAETEERLRSAGIAFRRLIDPNGYPMHNKFVIAEDDHRRWVAFGSFNWTTRSFWLNREICAVSEDEALVQAFEDRWQALDQRAGAPGSKA
jgi:phosphatidylserine/phosphatidylglycerophosphate/cardiolipin synthase-like enzyme